MLSEPLTLPPRRWQQFIVAGVVGVLRRLADRPRRDQPRPGAGAADRQRRGVRVRRCAPRSSSRCSTATDAHPDRARAHLPRAQPPVLRPRPVPRARAAAPPPRRPRHPPRVQHRVGARGSAAPDAWPSARAARRRSRRARTSARWPRSRPAPTSASPGCGATSSSPQDDEPRAHGRRRHRHHPVRLAAAPRAPRRGGPRHRARLRRVGCRRSWRSATSSRHPESR